VRVLVDAYGSDTLRQDCVAPLIATGGELRCFNPLRIRRLSVRNHRKLLRADGEAVIGGLKPQTSMRSTSSRSSSSAQAPTRTERLPRFRTEGPALPAGNAGRLLKHLVTAR
jgi:phosphatidylserine/phosphatidylglycerophosphate/cardiolipin synthase-like enzyme